MLWFSLENHKESGFYFYQGEILLASCIPTPQPSCSESTYVWSLMCAWENHFDYQDCSSTEETPSKTWDRDYGDGLCGKCLPHNHEDQFGSLELTIEPDMVVHVCDLSASTARPEKPRIQQPGSLVYPARNSQPASPVYTARNSQPASLVYTARNSQPASLVYTARNKRPCLKAGRRWGLTSAHHVHTMTRTCPPLTHVNMSKHACTHLSHTFKDKDTQDCPVNIACILYLKLRNLFVFL